jgi:hypothetical protein
MIMTHVIWNEDHTKRLPCGQRLARAVQDGKHWRVWTAGAEKAIRIPHGIFTLICVGPFDANKEETPS